MYRLILHKNFERKFEKLTKNNKVLKTKVISTLEKISQEPFATGLRTHKVNTRNFGHKFSSRVIGDLRIIWDFGEDDEVVILILTIGGHSGKNKVYK